MRKSSKSGWPYSYFGQHVDTRVKPERPELVAKAIVPDFALGNHVAPLGLTFASGDALPERYRSGAFVGLHGSWNRKPHSGYKVIFVPFTNGRPAGNPLDVLTGFLTEDGYARGRPVGVEIDRRGALLVQALPGCQWPLAAGALLIASGIAAAAASRAVPAQKTSRIRFVVLLVLGVAALVGALAIEIFGHWSNGLRPTADAHTAMVQWHRCYKHSLLLLS
jgi:hypothetical protein